MINLFIKVKWLLLGLLNCITGSVLRVRSGQRPKSGSCKHSEFN